MTDQPNTGIPQYSVNIWELLLILMGAIAIAGAAAVGLGIKVLNNAFDPVRAEAIARSLMDYKIPGGSQGIFGINIGSAKLAWVRSNTSPPDAVLFVGKTPINKEAGTDAPSEPWRDFQNPPTDTSNQEFFVNDSSIQTRRLCNKTIPLTIEEGQQIFGELSAPIPAMRYAASFTEGSVERVVIVTTNGEKAQEKADRIFNSLHCKK